jgi:Tol biopolymer transport system component/ribosomal protein L28
VKRLLASGQVAVLCSLAFVASAHAIYGPAAGGLGADIVSVDRASDEQADAESTDAAISADGRYVVFQTKATNLFEDDGETQQEQEAAEPLNTIREGGVFRYDRDTGQLRIVASGNLVVREGTEAGKLLVRGAENLSVSADGRYVAFSSAQRLVAQDSGENVQVYERDMEKAAGATGAYTLVSAKSGSEEAAVFANKSATPGGNPGAELWPNTAISDDGRYVIFRTIGVSDLPDRASAVTPAHQLFVRDLLEKMTTLLSRNEGTGEPVESALGPVLGPASLSADGSTVSWVSTDAQAQTRFLLGESTDTSVPYYLWRRWREPGTVTRRITGMADPEDPACPPEGTVSLAEPTKIGPCYGPLTEPESSGASIASAAPSLSADGYTVAFLASPALRPDVAKPGNLDVFVTSMRPGVTRKAGTSELTLSANGSNGRSLGSVESVALSPDASTLAFNTYRDLFVLGEPAPTGSFRPQPTASELYVVHRGAHTLERTVLGYGGGEPNGSTSDNPTLSSDGSTLAFVSGASNLIFGDGHSIGFNDAFTATLQTASGTAAPPGEVNAGSAGFSFTALASPELGVTVKRAKDGGVILLVETPGPGKLIAKARGSIPRAAAARSSRARKSSAGVAKAKKKTKPAPAVLLASGTATARSEGTTTLTLHVSAKYLKDLRRAGKLKANITIAFTPPAPAEALSDEVSATFVTATPVKRSSGKGRGKK